MRVEKLEEAEAAGLRALGFSVDAEGETAAIEMSDLTISIMRPWGKEEFIVEIDLPNDRTLVCRVGRQAIANAAE